MHEILAKLLNVQKRWFAIRCLLGVYQLYAELLVVRTSACW